jgi:hypothetical protein
MVLDEPEELRSVGQVFGVLAEIDEQLHAGIQVVRVGLEGGF